MSVGQHPYLHGAGDAALWAGGLGGTVLGGSWMLGGLGGGGGAGEYDSTGGGLDVTEPESDGAGVGETGPSAKPLKDPNPIGSGEVTDDLFS